MIAVRVDQAACPTLDPLAMVDRLGSIYGPNELMVYADGRTPARRMSYVAFGEVLSIDIRHGQWRATGPASPIIDDLLGPLLAPGAPWWQVLDTVLAQFEAPRSGTELLFGGWCYLGYEATHREERIPEKPATSDLPTVHLRIPAGIVRIAPGGSTDILTYVSSSWSMPPAEQLLDAAHRASGARHSRPRADRSTAATVTDEISRDEFIDWVSSSLDHIAAGDFYQVQLGHTISVRSTRAPRDVYDDLCRLNPSPHAFLWPLGASVLIGASPESLVSASADCLSMRPLAGTCARTGDPRVDAHAEDTMRHDEKELSEHLMLVDLCRNDIAHVAVPASVRVSEYLAVERYSHVAHLVSEVCGTRPPALGSFEMLRSTFPAGTMTGAPKIRAMEFIEAQERSGRGSYAGAVGVVGVGGFVDTALCIRSLCYHDGQYDARASAGIVMDSDAGREWDETLAKMAAALSSVTAESSP